MSTSTDGQICLGYEFEEDTQFPWEEDLEAWWLVETGFTPTFYPFTPEGDYKERVKAADPRIDKYFEEQRKWEDAHPLPIVLVNYQSADYPAYIIAVPDTLLVANRGYPVVIPQNFNSIPTEKIEAFDAFCEKHFKGLERGKLQWYLSSYWG